MVFHVLMEEMQVIFNVPCRVRPFLHISTPHSKTGQLGLFKADGLDLIWAEGRPGNRPLAAVGKVIILKLFQSPLSQMDCACEMNTHQLCRESPY